MGQGIIYHRTQSNFSPTNPVTQPNGHIYFLTTGRIFSVEKKKNSTGDDGRRQWI